jgi:hypothetical protein
MGTSEQLCIPVNDDDGWRAALADVPHGFAHTIECCRAVQLTTNAPTHLFSLGRGDARVVCPLSERSYEGYPDVFTPYQFSGFAGNYPADHFGEDWRSFARDRGWVSGYFAMHPGLPNDSYYDSGDCFIENDLYVIDLRQSVDQLLALMDRNRRREVREFSTAARSVVRDREVLTRFLIDEHPAFLRRVGANAAAELTPATLAALANAESTLLIGAATQGRIEAAYLFGFTRWAGDCLLNVATPEGRRHSTSLLWNGILELKARGVPLLNLGGGVRPGDSVARAKQRFGPTRVPFRSVKQVYHFELFDLLCRKARVDPHDREGYFPPYERSWHVRDTGRHDHR